MKKLLATIVIATLIFGIYPAAMAQMEYSAEFSILETAVDFGNAPYSDGKTVFVPLEEVCSYLNLSLSKDGEFYTVTRREKTAVIQSENMLCTANGEEVKLSMHPAKKNGVLYVPGDFFEVCLGMPVSLSANGRSMNITPNVYTVDIDGNHAAAISGASPEADTLAVAATAYDSLFESGERYAPEKQKSVYYLVDLKTVSDLDITKVEIGLYIAKGGNNNPYINLIRTDIWEKGNISFNNRPAEHAGAVTASVTLGSNYKKNQANFIYNSFDITDMSKNALREGSLLSLKVQGNPTSGATAPKDVQAAVRGVNTQYAPKVYVTTEENFTFPIKKNALKISDASDYDDAELLASLGIVTTEDEFPVNLTEAKISRGDFVKFALKLKNDHRSAGSAMQHFADVPVDNEYFADVAGAYAEGIVAGEQGSSFRPYDAITVNEACAVIGRILGYDEYAIRNGGYAQGYVKAATLNSLLSNVKSENGVLTYRGAVKMLVNALDAPMFVANVFTPGVNAEYIFDDRTTVLTEYFDAEEIKGTVTANEYSSISGITAGSNHIAIDGKKLSLRYEGYSDFLGYEVKAYYNRENELLYMGIKEGNVDTVDLSCVAGVSDGSSIAIKYEEDGKTKSISFAKADVIYNGKAVPSGSVRGDMFDVDGGQLVKLSCGRVIVSAYTTMIAYGIDYDDEVISDKYDARGKALRLKNTDYYSVTDTKGKTLTLDKVKQGSVLSVAKSIDGKIVKIIASDKKVSGTIQTITDGGTEDEVLEIAGLSYKTANRYNEWTKTLVPSKSGIFYLDAFGHICDFENGEQENVAGYMIDMDYASGSSLSSKLQAAVMVKGSEKYKLCNLADKVKINGTPEKDHRRILEMFSNDEGFIQQAVLFSTNGNGEINEINTAVNAEDGLTDEELAEIDDNTLVKNYNGSAYYRASSKRLSDRFYWDIGENPAVAVPDNVTSLDDFEMISDSVKTGTITAEVYTMGIDTPVAEMVILRDYQDNAMAVTYAISVAQKKVKRLDEDGEYVLELRCAAAPGTIETITVPDEKASLLDDIECGDIIVTYKNSKGELHNAVKYYDASEKTIERTAGNINSSFRVYGGYAVDKKDKYVKLTSDKNNVTSTNPADFYWIDLVSAGALYKYSVDGKNVEVQKATIDDVFDYKTVPYASSGLLIHTKYSLMQKTFIIELDKPANSGTYEVKFDGNGNTAGAVPGGVFADIGDTITIPGSGTVMRDEYRFIGWRIGDIVYQPGDSYTVTSEDTVFVAEWEWEGRQYHITFAGGDGAVGESFVKTTSDAYPSIQMPEATDENGYKFTKLGYAYRVWTDGVNDYTPGETYNIASEITITPKWVECWDGVSTSEPAVVTRDGQEYYKITNGAEFAWFANKVDESGGDGNVNAYLEKDIRLNFDGETTNNWAGFAIGNVNAFNGTFDGNGHKIINYYCESGSNYSGMWRKVHGGSIKNLTFENAKFVSVAATSTGTYSAIVCGEAIDGEFDSITVSGSAAAANGKYMNGFASIVGYSKISAAGEAVVINNCVNNLTIDASAAPEILTSSNNTCLAGIAGKVNSGTTITNCTNNAAIYGPKTPNVGGIAGYMSSGNTIDNCKNTAEITGYDNVGQIYGKKSSSATVTNSSANTGTVNVTK